MNHFDLYKKVFGETVAKFLRSGLSCYEHIDAKNVIHVLKETFPIKSTRKKLIPLMEKEINSLFVKKELIEIETKTMSELANESGYEFIVCDTLEKARILFSKYYKKDELICSLKENSSRFNESYVAFLKRKNIENIKRGENPHYRDEYSTSLLCIQISKKSGSLKCISRYNHSVSNPDFVYNNLDGIIKGMHYAFYNHFGLEVKYETSDLPQNIIQHKNQYFYYVEEYDGNYWGDGFAIKSDGTLILLEEKDILIEGTVYQQNGEFVCYGNKLNLPKFKKVIKNKNIIKCVLEDDTYLQFTLNENKEIIELEGNVVSIGNVFLFNNKNLTSIELPNVVSIGNYFLCYNEILKLIELPKVVSIGNDFLCCNKILTSIELPNVVSIGNGFLKNNKNLTSIELPNVVSIGDYFLCHNKILTSIDLPKVVSIGNGFLYYNEDLTSIDIPNVTSIGDNFLYYNENLTSIDLPNVTSIGNCFLYYNKNLTSIDLPNVTSIGNGFLHYNNNKEMVRSIIRRVK